MLFFVAERVRATVVLTNYFYLIKKIKKYFLYILIYVFVVAGKTYKDLVL